MKDKFPNAAAFGHTLAGAARVKSSLAEIRKRSFPRVQVETPAPPVLRVKPLERKRSAG